jgi:hypothetical protein
MKRMMKVLCRLVKPLMNERGSVGDPPAEPAPNAVELDENGFIPGTSYKSVADLVKGHSELKGKLDSQGNELGALRKFAETVEPIVKGALNKKEAPAAAAPAGPDYEAEIAAVQSQIKDLDPMADNYQKTLADLVAKSNLLVAKAQHEKTLNAAGEMFKKELSERDSKAAKDAFLRDNPSFSTPEMQARINDFLAKDKTGMEDPFTAFRKIEADDARIEKDRLAAENAEMKKVLELSKGKETTGKVVVKGQAPTQPTKQPKATGKDLDAGMAAVLANMRGA